MASASHHIRDALLNSTIFPMLIWLLWNAVTNYTPGDVWVKTFTCLETLKSGKIKTQLRSFFFFFFFVQIIEFESRKVGKCMKLYEMKRVYSRMLKVFAEKYMMPFDFLLYTLCFLAPVVLPSNCHVYYIQCIWTWLNPVHKRVTWHCTIGWKYHLRSWTK